MPGGLIRYPTNPNPIPGVSTSNPGTPGSMAGVPGNKLFTTPDPSSSPITNSYKLYNSGVEQNAGDYSDIMQAYKDLYSRISSTPTSVTPQTTTYSQSPDSVSALANLKDLSANGGYSDEAIRDLRARGISPIRSIYASAQRNVDRQRSLQGGYSPNYGAVSAKMAREESDLISGKTQDVNASIADNVARNRLGIAGTYASAAGHESDAMNANNVRNATATDDANKFNVNGAQQTNDELLRIIQGRQGLYGTTPALSSLFGNQALNLAQLQEEINQNKNKNSSGIISQLGRI